jgi:hypothetical protein
MESVGLAGDERLMCSKCGRPASFLSPVGFFCPTDALLAAAFHDWIPIQIRSSPFDGREQFPGPYHSDSEPS